MIQGIVVALIFVAAVGYLCRMIVKQFQAKTACATGCGKCDLNLKMRQFENLKMASRK